MALGERIPTSVLDYISCNSQQPPPLTPPPPAPNDAGLAVGALWAVTPPLVRQPLEYLGFAMWDEHLLEIEAHRRPTRFTEKIIC